MKFLCPNCKAKYQIADEKVAGRTLRMDCRRCGHNITIRADMRVDDADDVEVAKPSARPAGAARGGSVVGPSPVAASQRAPRPAGLTGAHGAVPSGSALGADFRRNVGTTADAPRSTPLDQWHVAINDVPVGPLRRDEILRKSAMGAVTVDSLCWREGLDDWRPIRDVPELAALLRRSLAPEPAARAPLTRGPAAASPRGGPAAPRGAPAARLPRPSNVVPIGGRLGASAAALDEHEVDDGTDEPTRVGSVDLAELEARALSAERGAKRAERDAKRAEHDAKRASEEAKARAEAEAAEARTAEARAAEARAAEARAAEALEGKRPPTGKVVSRPLAPPPKPLGKPDTGKVPLSAPKPAGHVPPKPAAPPPTLAPLSPEAEDELPIAAPSFAAAPEPAPAVAAPASSASAAEASVPAAPPIAPAPTLVARDKEREERRGLPVGAWIAIAGAVSFGGVLAVMVGNHFLSTPAVSAPTQTAPETPASAVAAVEPPATPVAEVEVPPEPAPEAPTEEAPTETVAATTPDPAHTGTTRRTGTSTSTTTSSPTTPVGATTSTKAPSGRFADFVDSPSGAGPAAIPTGTSRSLVDDGERSPARSGQAELTADQIRAVITRERPALNRCWESELRRIGQAATVRLDVDLAIGGSGTVTSVTTRGQSVGTLSDCIERNVRRWRFPPVSGSTQTSFPLVFSGTD
jgi:predicted Zn finger-like uncharacterized protein